MRDEEFERRFLAGGLRGVHRTDDPVLPVRVVSARAEAEVRIARNRALVGKWLRRVSSVWLVLMAVGGSVLRPDNAHEGFSLLWATSVYAVLITAGGKSVYEGFRGVLWR